MATKPARNSIVWRESAQRDLDEIEAYVRQFSPVGAARIWRRVIERVEQLREFPHLAPATPDRPDIRIMAVPATPYLVVYSVHSDRVVIRAVFHGAQDRR